jgi:hypothetical protein
MVRMKASDNLDLKVARHFASPVVQASSLSRAQAWFGLELFGRPVSPWGALIAPVPVAAAVLLAVRLFALPAHTWPWAAARLGEAAWLCLMPFVFATIYQAMAMALSEHVWRESEGERHIDYSARMGHYVAGIGLAVLPLVALQLSDRVLGAYMAVGFKVQSLLAPGQSIHMGYDPDVANLMVLGVLPLVLWQARRLLARVPAGRLLGFQRELARLKGAVAWDQKAWGEMVGETFARWMADLQPSSVSREASRRARLHWMNFQREVVAAYQQAPVDLARANRALATFRQGL